MADFKLSESTLIQAKIEEIFAHVAYGDKRILWDPFIFFEPSAVTEASQDLVTWSGKGRNIKSGSLELIERKGHEFVSWRLKMKGMKASIVSYRLQQEGPAVRLTWDMDSQMPLLIKALLGNMLEHSCHSSFKFGLDRLKAHVDPSAAPFRIELLEKQEVPAQILYGIKFHCRVVEIKKAMDEGFGPLLEEFGDNIQVSRCFYTSKSNPMKDVFDGYCAVVLKNSPEEVKNTQIEKLDFPGGSYCGVDYTGRYDSSFFSHAWHAAMSHCMNLYKYKRSAWSYEEYVRCHTDTGNPDEYLTKIMVPTA